MQKSNQSQALYVKRSVLFKRLALFAGLWLLLTKAALSSWVIGLIVVPIATALSLMLLPPAIKHHHKHHQGSRICIPGLLGFIPFFIWQSLRGGWQAARFALQSGLPLQPGFFVYQTQLPAGSARVFFLHLTSLMPGTLSATIDDDRLHVHALTDLAQSEQDLRQSEQKVAALFGKGAAHG